MRLTLILTFLLVFQHVFPDSTVADPLLPGSLIVSRYVQDSRTFIEIFDIRSNQARSLPASGVLLLSPSQGPEANTVLVSRLKKNGVALSLFNLDSAQFSDLVDVGAKPLSGRFSPDKSMLLVTTFAFGSVAPSLFTSYGNFSRKFQVSGKNLVTALTLSADGDSVTYVAGTADGSEVVMSSLSDPLKTKKIPNPNSLRRCENPVWHPEQTLLLILCTGESGMLFIVDPLTGQSKVVQNSSSVEHAVWSPDGAYVLVSERENQKSPARISSISVDGFAKQVVRSGGADYRESVWY